MAKIYKLECYVVDCHDDYKDGEQLIDDITKKLSSGMILHPRYEVSNSFEWHDDINLNKNKCRRYDCEQYFKPIYFEENDWFEDEDLRWIEGILTEINFKGLLDNMTIEKVKWTLTQLQDLYDTYEFKARTQSHNDGDTYYDFLYTCERIKELSDYLLMFYEEDLGFTERQKSNFMIYD